jgi:hypothetical protein
MRGRKTGSVPVEIEKAREQLEDWRRKQPGRARIPEDVWAVAVELARQHGVHQTARTLRLDYVKLKKRLGGGCHGSGSEVPATFVEVMAPEGSSLCECSMEMEGRRGKIRIQIKGATMPDLAALSRALLESQ